MGFDSVALTDLEEFLNKLLLSDRFKDYCPNGLQVQGSEEVQHIATACSASKAAIEASIAAGANALIVHHGILWGKSPAPIAGMLKGRVAPLIKADCSLFGYHSNPLVNDWATWYNTMYYTAPGKMRWCRKWALSPAAAKARCWRPPNWVAMFLSAAKHPNKPGTKRVKAAATA